MFSLYWKEGGIRRSKHLACMQHARLLAQQITVRITNGWKTMDEVTKRDIELLRHCESLAGRFGVNLAAAMDEWASARRAAGDIPISDAVRFYLINRTDIFPRRTTIQVVGEFIQSRTASGVSDAYVRTCQLNFQKFTRCFPGQISEITVGDLSRFLSSLDGLGPVSRNNIRTNLVTLFGFAKRQGYLHPERKTAAEQTEQFKVPDSGIEIFTPEEMRALLLAANARILPLIAIGGFAGIRSAEIRRLEWNDIKWDRGHIEIAGKKAKTAARRLVPLAENLRAWLAPWREKCGPIIMLNDTAGPLMDTAVKAGIPGGWRQNALRHSYISYRVAQTGDVARTSLEAGNSPKIIFRHYREVVDTQSATEWFSIVPPDGWDPLGGIRPTIRERLQQIS
ncbi:MAG: site-specific integrase [Verrucomicrobiales bacterium]|nr:site-specific integrase [Verrucomicrobiales bacterium]